MNDVVNKPNHYQLFADGTEALDVIKAVLTREEFIGYAKGNILKYRLRAGKKDDLAQDIAKADTYAAMMEQGEASFPKIEPPPLPPQTGSTEALLEGLAIMNSSCHEKRIAAGDDKDVWGCLNCLASDCESATPMLDENYGYGGTD